MKKAAPFTSSLAPFKFNVPILKAHIEAQNNRDVQNICLNIFISSKCLGSDFQVSFLSSDRLFDLLTQQQSFQFSLSNPEIISLFIENKPLTVRN